MKKITNIIIAISCSVMIIGCDDLIEKDISDINMQVIHPQEGVEVTSNVTQFQWLNVEDADNYRIQVSNSDNLILLDSLVDKNSFALPLDSGEYSWRVRGENSAYETKYNFPVDFVVAISEDISDQLVILESPSNEIYINSEVLNYSWALLKNASSYRFQILKAAGEDVVLSVDDHTKTSITIDPGLFDVDAEYLWRVKGVNETAETEFSSRSIFIDRVDPNTPVLSLPTDNESTTTGEITFSWDINQDTGNVLSDIYFSFELASDDAFSNIVFELANLSESSVNYTIDDAGEYFWRVKSFDVAGNESAYSQIRTLEINE